MKGILKMDDKNKFYLYNIEKGGNYYINDVIDLHRKQKVRIFIKTPTSLIHKEGYIASKRLFKGIRLWLEYRSCSLCVRKNRG
jgi:hypothetical protein